MPQERVQSNKDLQQHRLNLHSFFFLHVAMRILASIAETSLLVHATRLSLLRNYFVLIRHKKCKSYRTEAPRHLLKCVRYSDCDALYHNMCNHQLVTPLPRTFIGTHYTVPFHKVRLVRKPYAGQLSFRCSLVR